MSKAPSEHSLPRQVDPRKFAQQRIELEGVIEVSALPRLAAAVAEPTGRVAVELAFGIGDQGEKVLNGTARAQVQVICQRCLEAMPLELEGKLSLAIVWNEEQAESLPKYLDPWITGEGAADLYEIIEEELLLNLPMVAYHEEACVDKASFSSGEEVDEPEPANNPFSVLEQLKGSPK